MKDFPSCFGEQGVQVTDSSAGAGAGAGAVAGAAAARMAQNLVTCTYRAKLGDQIRLITVTWCKNLMGQGLSVSIDDQSFQCICKVDMKPWLFSRKKGSKTFQVGSNRIDVFWDLSSAKYGSGPEPLEGYYLAVVSDSEMALMLGDMSKEAYRKTHAIQPSESTTVLVSKKEHVFGKRIYATKAQLCDNGQVHDIAIECHSAGLREPWLTLHIDKKIVMQVKHLTWKFRGNQTVLVDGLPVEVFWDVHNWLFNPTLGNAVFMFQTFRSSDKSASWAKIQSCSSVLPWHPTHSFKERELQGLGFSLLLYAWKSE